MDESIPDHAWKHADTGLVGASAKKQLKRSNLDIIVEAARRNALRRIDQRLTKLRTGVDSAQSER
jgi:hypothetical protein